MGKAETQLKMLKCQNEQMLKLLKAMTNHASFDGMSLCGVSSKVVLDAYRGHATMMVQDIRRDIPFQRLSLEGELISTNGTQSGGKQVKNKDKPFVAWRIVKQEDPNSVPVPLTCGGCNEPIGEFPSGELDPPERGKNERAFHRAFAKKYGFHITFSPGPEIGVWFPQLYCTKECEEGNK